MRVSPYRESDRGAVLCMHAETYGPLDLARVTWQPCQQIESLGEECAGLVAADGRRVIGYAAARRVGADSFRLNLLVGPRDAGRGTGTRLLAEIESGVARRGGRRLEARLLEGMPRSLGFALSRGFAEVHRMRGLSLAARDFSFGKWRALGRRLRAEGFTVTTLAEEAEAGQDPLEKLFELQRRAAEGWPLADPWGAHDYTDAWLRAYFSGVRTPRRFSIMKRGEEYVGYTSAERESAVGTAVHPDYRGRGVATYLKACNLKRLVDEGVEYFESASASPAMLRVNERLGYRPTGVAEIRVIKVLPGGA